MATHDIRRTFKRPNISDQQKRRELSLLRQQQGRRDAQRQARFLASTVLSFSNHNPEPLSELESTQVESETETSLHEESEPVPNEELDVRQASKLKGHEARRWFARQLLLPEWMIDIPEGLNHDWF